MVPLKKLRKKGLTNARLRDIFTCEDVEKPEHKIRERIEKRISDRIRTGIQNNARHSSFYIAVDAAWDSNPITKENIPLLLFAQGKIKLESCAKRLQKLDCADEFVEYEDKNKSKIKGINMPRLYEVSVNLVRSLLMRRIAAQAARYSNLWPYFKYEARGSKMEDRARADLLSSRVDIMADQYGYRRQFNQAIRDMFLYSHTTMFPSCAWDVVKSWDLKKLNEAFEAGEDEFTTIIEREGIDFINPHPTRVYHDRSQPLSKINTDTGPSFLGFWDIVRYGDVKDDNGYFNRDKVKYSQWFPELITDYPELFDYYYDPKTVKAILSVGEGGESANIIAAQNDRKMNVGRYADQDIDKGVCLVNHYEKINPKQEGIADYPFDVWVRFVTTPDDTVVYAEWLPSIPCIYGGINENDNRDINLGMAHDLLGFQDQLTNILSQLMHDMRSSMVQLWLINKDLLDEEGQKYVKSAIQDGKMYTEAKAILFSGAENETMGVDTDKVIKLIEVNITRKIDDAFKAIERLLAMAERLLVLSPQELGQNSQREASASEVVEIAKSVDTIYTFISDGVDEMRGGAKKLIYESLLACGQSKIKLPNRQMFKKETLKAAGFEEEGGMLVGTPESFILEYNFNSRDGAERTSNVEAAKVLLNSLNNLYASQEFREFLGKERLANIFNEIFRLTGSSYGHMFELSQDELEKPQMGEDAANKLLQLIEVLDQRLDAVEDATGVSTPPDEGAMPPGGSPPAQRPLAPTGEDGQPALEPSPFPTEATPVGGPSVIPEP